MNFRPIQVVPRVLVLCVGAADSISARYLQFAASTDVTLLRLGTPDERQGERAVSDTLREIVVPRSQQQAESEAALVENSLLAVSTPIAMRLLPSSPDYAQRLRTLSEHVDFCLVSEAALGDVAAATAKVPLIYDARLIESSLPTANTPGSQLGAILADVRIAEQRLCERAAAIVVRGSDDAKALHETLSRSYTPVVIGTGIAYEPGHFRTRAQRQIGKEALRLGERILAIFESDGSAESLLGICSLGEVARERPQLLFFVVGPYLPREYPPNMRFLGLTNSADRAAVRNVADFAAVPSDVTTGTSAMVIDYVLAGVPLIASEAALTNLPLLSERDVLIGPPAAMPALIDRLLTDRVAGEARAVNALGAILSTFPPISCALNFRSLLDLMT